ncbi:hypothetical protein AKO1_011466 [Acrasis kona]|uniref:CNH domain-containing protein n=1 Tax=Acrasis kona TaxID=1008807 RepID=A0AAW2Z3E9_9EUKA
MSDAKVPFSQYSLLSTQNVPIKCIHALDDYLYIGTSNKIMMYKLKPFNKGVHVDNALEIEYTKEAHSKSAVVGIQTDPIRKLCFVHYEGVNKKGQLVIYNLDLENGSVQNGIDDLACFCVDQNQENARLVVIANRKVQIHHFDKYDEEEDFQLEPGRVISIVSDLPWTYVMLINNHLITQNKNNDTYCLTKLKSGEKDSDQHVSTPYWSSWSGSKTCKLPRVLCIDDNSAMIRHRTPNHWAPTNFDGSRYYLSRSDKINQEVPFKYTTPEFSMEPRDVAMCFPFVMGILPHKVEVYSLYFTVNHTAEESKYYYCANNVPVWSDAIDAEQCCASSKRFYVVDAKNNVFYFTPPNTDVQIKQLQTEFYIPQAQDLFSKKFEGTNERIKSQKLSEMQDNAAYSYLFKGYFKESFEYMYMARTTSHASRKDARHVLQFFKDCSITVGQSKLYPLIPNEFFSGFESGKKSAHGPTSIQERLQNAINRNISKNKSDISDSAWVNILITKAMNALMVYLHKVLEDLRQQPKKSESENYQQACIEYVLIALYLRNVSGNPNAYNNIEKIIDSDANCFNFDTTLRDKFVVLLKQADCYRHVALLIKSAGPKSYLAALSTLQKHVDKDLFYSLHDGIKDAIDILVKIDGNDLMTDEIKFYISWVINQNPTKAVRIFTCKRNIMPDSSKVLDFLKAYPLSLKDKYLCYLVAEEHVTDLPIHTDYVMTLIENIYKVDAAR